MIKMFFKLSLIAVAQSFSIPLATQLNDVVIGQVDICQTASLLSVGHIGCGSFTDLLVNQATQNIPVVFSMTQIPNIVLFPTLLQNSGSASMTFQCSVVPGSITLTGFTAQAQKLGSTNLQNAQMSYIATFNPNIYFQTITIMNYGNNYQLNQNFAQTFSQIPLVYGYINQFSYNQLFDYDLEQVTNTNFVFNMGINDLSGALSAVAIIIDQSIIPKTNSFIGIGQQLVTIVSPTTNQSLQIQSLSYCLNWSSNQAIFGFTKMNQSLPQALFGVQLTNLYDSLNCTWNLTIQSASVNAFSIQFVSLSLLTCLDINHTYSNQKCYCPTSYYDYLSRCQSCDQTCLICVSGSKTGCQSCDPLSFRLLKQSSCQCQNGYYDDNINTLCQICHFTCLTCDGITDSHCQSCDLLSYRIFTTNRCLCQIGYFSDGSNAQCKVCSTKCLSCDNFRDDNCLSCQSLQYRFLDGSSCVCVQGYTELGRDYCQKIICHYSCGSCFGPNLDQCTTCDVFNKRKLSSKICLCTDGYYDSNKALCSHLNITNPNECFSNQYLVNQQCIDCDPICASCKGPTQHDCILCLDQKYIDLKIYSTPPLFVKYEIIIKSVLQIFSCVNNQVQDQNIELQYTGLWTIKDNLNISIYDTKQLNVHKQNEQMIIPANTLTFSRAPYKAYYILKDGAEQIASAMTNLILDSLGKNIQLQPSSARWGYKQQNKIHLLIYDLELSQEPVTDLSFYRLFWNCSMNFNQTCLNIYKQPLKFNNSLANQQFGSSTLKPYETYFFQVSVTYTLTQQVFTQQSVIQITEENVPQLELSFNPDYLSRRVNIQDEIIINYLYDDIINSDQLYFSANLYYNFNAVATIKYNYYQIKLIIWNNFIDFKIDEGLQLLFIGSVFNPQYFMPSYAQITFNINQPPQGCLMKTDIVSPFEIIQMIQISILNCTDLDQPLLYKFYFLSSQDALWNVETQFENSLALNDFSDQDSIQTYILSAPYFLIMASIQDSYGGLTNISQNITIQKVIDKTNIIQNITSILEQLQDFSLLRYLLVISKSNYVNEYPVLLQMIQDYLQVIYLKQDQGLFWYQQLSQIYTFLFSDTNSPQQYITHQNIGSIYKYVDQRTYDLKYQWGLIEQRNIKNSQIIQNQFAINQILLQSDQLMSLISSLLQFNENDNPYQGNNHTSNQLLQQQLYDIGDIKVLISLPNEKIYQFKQRHIKIQTAQMTELKASEYFMPDISFYNEEDNHYRILSGKINKKTKIYSIKTVDSDSNSYSTQNQWQYNKSNYSVKNYNVSQTNESPKKLSDLKNNSRVETQSYITYQIRRTQNENDSNATKLCVSLNQQTQEWSSEQCNLIQDNQQQICQCKRLTAVTIIDDYQSILNKNDEIFKSKSLGDIAKFQWYKVATFYIVTFMTSIYIITLIWSIMRDRKDKLSIHPSPILDSLREKVSPPTYDRGKSQAQEFNFFEKQEVVQLSRRKSFNKLGNSSKTNILQPRTIPEFKRKLTKFRKTQIELNQMDKENESEFQQDSRMVDINLPPTALSINIKPDLIPRKRVSNPSISLQPAIITDNMYLDSPITTHSTSLSRLNTKTLYVLTMFTKKFYSLFIKTSLFLNNLRQQRSYAPLLLHLSRDVYKVSSHSLKLLEWCYL